MAWHGSVGGGWAEELAFHQVGVGSVRFLCTSSQQSARYFHASYRGLVLTSHPLPLPHHRPPPTPLRLRPPSIHRSRHRLAINPARDKSGKRVWAVREEGVGGVEVVGGALGDESMLYIIWGYVSRGRGDHDDFCLFLLVGAGWVDTYLSP